MPKKRSNWGTQAVYFIYLCSYKRCVKKFYGKFVEPQEVLAAIETVFEVE